MVIATYTFTFLSSRLAEGACGLRTTLTAIAAATAKATEVKKPKTFWIRTRLECMAGGCLVAVWLLEMLFYGIALRVVSQLELT